MTGGVWQGRRKCVWAAHNASVNQTALLMEATYKQLANNTLTSLPQMPTAFMATRTCSICNVGGRGALRSGLAEAFEQSTHHLLGGQYVGDATATTTTKEQEAAVDPHAVQASKQNGLTPGYVVSGSALDTHMPRRD